MVPEIKVNKHVWEVFFMNNCNGRRNVTLFPQFRKACHFFGIKDQAMFLAQICHESGFLKYKSENLNYSWQALRRVFGKYFRNNEIAKKYARQPEKIASRVYANRMGNGNEKSREGWKFRGRLFIQTTGKNNYKKLNKFFKGMKFKGEPINVVKNPDLLLNKEFMFWPAALFYVRSGCNACKDVRKVTKIINGGYNGLKHRAKLYREIIRLTKSIH